MNWNCLSIVNPILFWCTAEFGSPEDFSAIEIFYVLLLLLHVPIIGIAAKIMTNYSLDILFIYRLTIIVISYGYNCNLSDCFPFF